MAEITQFVVRPHQAPAKGYRYEVVVQHNATILVVSAVDPGTGSADVVSVKRSGSPRQIVGKSRLREVARVATLGAIARHAAGKLPVTKFEPTAAFKRHCPDEVHIVYNPSIGYSIRFTLEDGIELHAIDDHFSKESEAREVAGTLRVDVRA